VKTWAELLEELKEKEKQVRLGGGRERQQK